MTDPLEILQAVKAFYESAFSQLLTLTVVILGVGGVILPIVFQFIQYRSFRTEATSLESNIASQINHAKEELKLELEKKFVSEKEQLQEHFKVELDAMRLQMDRRIMVAQAGTFFLQAANALRLKNVDLAARDYAHAAKLAFEGNDDQNGQRALIGLIQNCLPNLNSQSFDNVDQLDLEIDNLLDTLKSKNENGRFVDSISELKAGRDKAKKRNPATPEAKKQTAK